MPQGSDWRGLVRPRNKQATSTWVFAMTGAWLLAGCSVLPGGQATATPEARQAAVAVQVAKVTVGPIASTLSLAGEVKSVDKVVVVPKVPGRIEKIMVSVGSRVEAAQPIAELEKASLEAQVQQAEAALAAARAKLATLEAGARAEAVAQAQANLDAAKARLQQLLDGPSAGEMEAARLGVQQARDALWAAQIARDAACGRKYLDGGASCNAGDAQVSTAETAVEMAQAKYNALTAPPNPQTVEQAKAAVRAAEEALKLAQNPFTANDVEAARAGAAQAEAGLKLAQLQLAEATVAAPVSGTVAEKFLDVGAMAGPTTPIASIVSGGLEVAVSVEEGRLGEVAPGEEASISVPAYPGATFSGTVREVAPTLDPRTRTAAVKIAPQDPEHKLKPGMSAQVTITTKSVGNALLVPRAALVGEGSQRSVFKVVAEKAVRQPVQIGLVDEQSAQIVQGLSEGDEVVTAGQGEVSEGTPVVIRGR